MPIDVSLDSAVKVEEGEFVEVFIEDGKVVLMLACEVEAAGEVDHLEARHLTKSQVDALIEALQKQKELLL